MTIFNHLICLDCERRKVCKYYAQIQELFAIMEFNDEFIKACSFFKPYMIVLTTGT